MDGGAQRARSPRRAKPVEPESAARRSDRRSWLGSRQASSTETRRRSGELAPRGSGSGGRTRRPCPTAAERRGEDEQAPRAPTKSIDKTRDDARGPRSQPRRTAGRRRGSGAERQHRRDEDQAACRAATRRPAPMSRAEAEQHRPASVARRRARPAARWPPRLSARLTGEPAPPADQHHLQRVILLASASRRGRRILERDAVIALRSSGGARQAEGRRAPGSHRRASPTARRCAGPGEGA